MKSEETNVNYEHLPLNAYRVLDHHFQGEREVLDQMFSSQKSRLILHTSLRVRVPFLSPNERK